MTDGDAWGLLLLIVVLWSALLVGAWRRGTSCSPGQACSCSAPTGSGSRSSTSNAGAGTGVGHHGSSDRDDRPTGPDGPTAAAPGGPWR